MLRTHRPVRVVLLAVALATGAGCAEQTPDTPAAGPSGRLPDVVIYLVDTLRADALGAYGATRGDSPALDALARESAVFEQAISQAPWTLPSVTSLFTSTYPSSHRILGHADRVGPQAETLVEYFKGLGYRTVGFASNTFGGRGAGLDQGFDEFTEHQFVQKLMEEHEAEGTHPLAPLHEWAAREQDERPFLLYVHTVEPHDPYEGLAQADDGRYTAPARDRVALQKLMHEQRRLELRSHGTPGLSPADRARLAEVTRELDGRAQQARDLYDGDVRQADANFARLVELLARQPRWKDTIVVVLSDHGEEFHEHGSWFHGQSAFQEMLRVPLILRVPGLTDGGLRVAPPVQLIDVLPTLAELAGGPPAAHWQGRSLLPLLRGAAPAQPSPVLSMRIITERNLSGARGDTETALILDGWKLIVHHDVRRTSLFDLTSDPGETRDLSQEQPERAAAMLALVQQRLRDLPVLPIRSAEELDQAAAEEKLRHLEDLGYVERVRDR